MKISKAIHIDISDDNRQLDDISVEVPITIDPEDLRLFFLEGKSERIILMNINIIIDFIKSIPDDCYKNLKNSTVTLIMAWFQNWLSKINAIRKTEEKKGEEQ